MIKRFLFTSILFQIQLCVIGQGDYNNRFQNIIPPSPSVSSLINLTSFPKTNYTGAVDINIPIYEIQLKDFSLPIALRYNTGGRKVSELSSWVGLGWALDVGGIISRTVNGSPDDQYVYATGSTPVGGRFINNIGYLLGGMDSILTFNDEFINSDAIELKKSVKLGVLNGFHYQNWDNDVNHIPFENDIAKRMDMLPDNFNINLLGKSYKLFFYKKDINSPIRCLTTPYSNFSIEYTLNTDLYSIGAGKKKNIGIISFNIVDGQGNKYTFGQYDSTKQAICSGFDNIAERGLDGGSTYSYGAFSNSSWHLTKIITNNNDTVVFNYRVENIRPPALLPFFKVRGEPVNSSPATPYDFPSNELVGNSLYSVTNQLLSIETKTEIISFIQDNQEREDLTNSYALKEILVQSKFTNQSIKDYKFKYNYFTTSSTAYPGFSYWPGGSTGDLNKRLKLTKLEDVSADGLLVNPYTFSYNETQLLPMLYSKEQDFWGYYNGNNAETLIPQLFVYPNYEGIDRLSTFRKFTFTGNEYQLLDGTANRNVNSNYNQACILKEIKYPTGGSEEYIYESNDYDNPDWGKYAVGGLRIQQIIKKDNSGNSLNRYFDYTLSSDPNKSSGRLLKYPVFANLENSLAYYYYNSAYAHNQNSLEYYKRFTFRNENMSFKGGENDGVVVGYSEVTEYDGNGKTIYKFSVPGDYTKSGDVNGTADCNIITDGYCDGLFKKPEIKWVRDFSILLTGSYSPPRLPGQFPNMNNLDLQSVALNIPTTIDLYPFLPSINYNWNRGLLLSETKYHNNSNKVFEKVINYSLPSIDSLFYLPALYRNGMFNDYNGVNDNPYGGSGASRFIILYSKYFQIANASKLTTTVTEKTYNDNINPNTFLQNSTTFDHYVDNRMLKSKIYTKSNGITDIVNFKYPYSSTTLSTGIKTSLLSRNVKEAIVENEHLVNGQSSEKVVNSFEINLLNDKHYVNNWQSYTNGLLSKSMTVQNIDKYNNFSLAYDLNNQKTEYIWDYKFSLPVAEILNINSIEDAAVTSFESDGKGGFAYTGVPIPVTLAPTGNLVYNLANGAITKVGLDVSKTYIVSYWSDNGQLGISNSINIITGRTFSGYTYYEHKVNGITNITLTGNANIDELRLYPQGALVNSYTYLPLVGIASKCDVNNRITYYQYDNFSRLVLIRDQDYKILKKICYNYNNQPEDCTSPTVYTNDIKTGIFTRNDCIGCATGSQVTYTVPEFTYTSTISKLDANTLAQAEVNKNGQAYANTHGTCTNFTGINITYSNTSNETGFTAFYTNLSTDITYTFNIPASGSGTLGCIPSGNYSLVISKTPAGITPILLFGSGCSYISGGFSATFPNLFVTNKMGGCRNITIEPDL